MLPPVRAVRPIRRRKPGARRRRSWPARILGWVIKGVFLFILVSILWVGLYRFVPPPLTFTMIGDMLGGRSVSRDWMSLDSIDRDMVRAAVAAEDSKFCSHWGFDQDAIAAAMRRNARGGSVIRGGSTISQQTAKNAFLWQGGGYFRKGLEAWFTLLIENLWGKRRIMEVYLNVAETGIGTYGVNAGAQRYFGHGADAMSRVEAARIAAILPLPKKRGAVAPMGFTRRYGNSIAARLGVVANEGLDGCVYADAVAPRDAPEPRAPAQPKAKQLPRQAAPLPGEEYEQPQPAAPSIQPAPPSEQPKPEIDPPPSPAPDEVPPAEPPAQPQP
jgi:monofunctional biosynthetic peptidoglycan transglycosylase